MKSLNKKVLSFMCSLAVCSVSVPVVEHLNNIGTYAVTESQSEFIENLGSAAQATYSQYGILPSMTIAQAILESSWGSCYLAQNYNFFGMKAGGSYSGNTVTVTTNEEVNGEYITVNCTFRAYDSFESGIEGYYIFITGNSRYSNLIWETDYRTACYKIKEDGWATDSSYSEKLINIIETYDLTRFDNVISDAPEEVEEVSADYELVTSGDGYYPACDAGQESIIDALKSLNIDSSYESRYRISEYNGIHNYDGTADENIALLTMLKAGTLKNPDYVPVIYIDTTAESISSYEGEYYPACTSDHLSIVDALKSLDIDSSYESCYRISVINGFYNYSGTAEENIALLKMLKAGTLKNPDYLLCVTTEEPTTTAITTTTVTTTTTSSATTKKLKATLTGDANLDGKVDISDVIAIYAYIQDSSKNVISPQGIANADVLGNDNGITADDALKIQRFVTGHIDSLK
ncbi:MAG: glucosaminidase domain-containing protein [Oscillospiraceae bacterium]|nr:glucosaminidase domain-containing protein [Oscillospiraceae bacterium]